MNWVMQIIADMTYAEVADLMEAAQGQEELSTVAGQHVHTATSLDNLS